MRPEGLSQSKIPMTPPQIEPVTFRLVAQFFNQRRQCLPRGTVKHPFGIIIVGNTQTRYLGELQVARLFVRLNKPLFLSS